MRFITSRLFVFVALIAVPEADGDNLLGVGDFCSVGQQGGCGTSGLENSGALANAAARAGCSSRPRESVAVDGDPWNISERDEELIRCAFSRWFPEHGESGIHGMKGMGDALAYGEITPRGVHAVLGAFGRLGAPLGPDDAFFDLGSGTGKVVLQAHLTTDVGNATGIEIHEKRHAWGTSAFAAAGVPEDAGRHAVLIQGDIRSEDLWDGASAVFACATVFPARLMLEVSWALGARLRPGAIFISSKALPGCHPAFRLLGSLTVEMSFSSASEVYVYAVPPMDVRPPTWLTTTLKEWEAAIADQFSVARASGPSTCTSLYRLPELLAQMSPEVLATCFGSHWPGVRGMQVRRAFAAATVIAAKGKNTLAALFPPFVLEKGQVAAAAKHLLVGDGQDALPTNCAFRELAAAAEADHSIEVQADRTGETGLVADLIDSFGDVNEKDVHGAALMHLIARMRHGSPAAVAVALAERRGDVNAGDKTKRTPLHMAAEVGKHVELARALIELRAKVSVRDKAKASPLGVAFKKGHDAIVDLLMSAGAESQDMW